MGHNPHNWASGEVISRSLLNSIENDLATAVQAGDLFFNVKNYGAKGDGVTDDSLAIGTAITAAGANGSLFFPPGTFRAQNLAPLSGQTWTGPGVIQRVAGSTASIVAASDVSNVAFVGLTFDGSRGAATATSNSGVFLTRSTRTQVRGCRFRNMPTNNAAVEFRGGVGNSVIGSSFTTVGYGVIVGLAYGSTDACHDNRIIGNFITGVDLNPVFVTENVGTAAGTVAYRVQNTLIANNTIQGWGDAGIESGSGCLRTIVIGNTLDTGGGAVASGILIRDNKWCTVSNNQVIGVTGVNSRGIIAVELNDYTRNLTLANNQVSGGQYGIYAGHVDGLEMSGNEVTAATSDGVVLAQVTNYTLNNNRVWLNGGNGVSVGVFGGTSSNVGTISGNTVLNNSQATAGSFDGIAVLASSSDTVIVGNTCRDTQGTHTQRYGITIGSASNDSYIVTNNNLRGNLSVGVNDGGTTAYKVKSNNLTD